jgi:hypothetical protein
MFTKLGYTGTMNIIKKIWDIFYYLFMGWAIPNSIAHSSTIHTAILCTTFGAVLTMDLLRIFKPNE